MRSTGFRLIPLLCAVAFVTAFAACAPTQPASSAEDPAVAEAAAEAEREASIARTRDQVRMLDDLYKTAVVLITEHYVDEPTTLSAASAAKALFAEMSKRGWHDVRLVGLTEDLVNPANAPSDDFERAAAERLLAGDAFYEEVVVDAGTDYLRYATPVPVVMEKCVMCHPSYEGNDGIIGSLSYRLALVQ